MDPKCPREQLRRRLDQPVNPGLVSTRPGPNGRPVKYIAGETLFNEAIHLGTEWNSRIVEIREPAAIAAAPDPCQAVVEVKIGTQVHQDVSADTKTNPDVARAIETSAKSAVTTATVRALKRFGPAFGLGLNDPVALSRCTPMQPLLASHRTRPPSTPRASKRSSPRPKRADSKYAAIVGLLDALPRPPPAQINIGPSRSPYLATRTNPLSERAPTSRWRVPGSHAAAPPPTTATPAQRTCGNSVDKIPLFRTTPVTESGDDSDDDAAFENIDLAALEAEALATD